MSSFLVMREISWTIVSVLLLATGSVEAGKCRGRYMEMRGGDGFIAQRGCRGLDTQIQEEYWTTVGYDGVLRDGRTTDDFLQFPELQNNGHSLRNSFVGYWEGPEIVDEITRSKYGENRHYEAFGHVFIKPDGRVCGWFVGMEREVVEVCGGFRVLSRSRRNPYEQIPFEWVQGPQYKNRDTLGFHHHKIAKYELNGDEVFFGDADINSRRFHGVSPVSETFVQTDVPEVFRRKVWLLKKKATLPPSDNRVPSNLIEEPRRPQDLDIYSDPHHEARVAHMRMYPYYDQYGRPSGSTSDSHRPAYDSYGRRLPFDSSSDQNQNQNQADYGQIQNLQTNQFAYDVQPSQNDPLYEQWLRNQYRIRGILPRGYDSYYQQNIPSYRISEPNESYPPNVVVNEPSSVEGQSYEPLDTRVSDESVSVSDDSQTGYNTQYNVNPGPVFQSEDTDKQAGDGFHNQQGTLDQQDDQGNVIIPSNQGTEHVRLLRYRPKTIIRDKKGNRYEQRVEDGKIVLYSVGSGEPKRIEMSDIDPKIEEILESRRRQELRMRNLLNSSDSGISAEPKSTVQEALEASE